MSNTNTPPASSNPTTTSASGTQAAVSAQPSQTATLSDTRDIQNVPKDAIIIEKILQSMGIKEFEPRVVEQLLELVYRYVSEVVDDAYVYMDHASRTDLDLEDVRLAIQTRVNHSYTEPPPVEFLLEVANQKNSQPFLLPKKQRVLLPPQHLCLSARNYQFTKNPIPSDLNGRKKRKQQDSNNGYPTHDDQSDLQQSETSLSSEGDRMEENE